MRTFTQLIPQIVEAGWLEDRVEKIEGVKQVLETKGIEFLDHGRPAQG